MAQGGESFDCAQDRESTDVTQDRESTDVTQDREPVERPVERRVERLLFLVLNNFFRAVGCRGRRWREPANIGIKLGAHLDFR